MENVPAFSEESWLGGNGKNTKKTDQGKKGREPYCTSQILRQSNSLEASQGKKRAWGRA